MAAFFLTLCLPVHARADAVSMDRSCPAGTRNAECHNAGRPLCVVAAGCPCSAGETCQRRSVCLSGLTCGGIPDNGLSHPMDVADTCSPGDTCGGSTTCTDQDVCVATGGGCAVSPESDAAGGVTLLVGVLALVVLRRLRGR